MRTYRVLASVAFLGLLACEDDKAQPVAPTPTEPAPAASALLRDPPLRRRTAAAVEKGQHPQHEAARRSAARA